jgi:hypothetical protein
MNETQPLPQLGPVVVRLLKGVLYREQQEEIWRDLMILQAQVIDYLRVIGLELEVDEAEGYVFLRQGDTADETGKELPKLISRRPLSYPVSLLCVLLRKKLVEADAGGGEARVILTRDQMVEMMRVFLPDQSNEAKLVDKIDTYIGKVVELGFLRKHEKENRIFEVRRIIKALVDAEWLAKLDEKLKAYHDHARTL